ncbi:hypothetical protein CoNPh8_CDS0005 [Staphylococcus phage S-CoN_Ph8]|nr:hypothetical protein CoNPh8_CDS0005 [Staphylococcus phage S-CoN_Ph8]WNM53675.1 hypothetical protein CoNPh13_CDS0205 [Staphylococcus phage S-CoN_Ph13]
MFKNDRGIIKRDEYVSFLKIIIDKNTTHML